MWAVGWIAEKEDFWADAGLTNLSVQEGEGSDDTAAGAVTGDYPVSSHHLAAGVDYWEGIDAGDIYIFGLNKRWSEFGLMWPEQQYGDSLDDLHAVTDTDEYEWVCSSGNALQTWDIINAEYDLDQTQDEPKVMSHAETATAIENGEVDIVYGSIDTVRRNTESVAENDDRFAEIDEMVVRGVSNNIHTLIGYPFVVNGDYYREHEEVIDDFLTAFLEGYSAAAHWAFTNPDDAIDFVIEITPDLQIPREYLANELRACIVTEIGLDGFEEGVGTLDTDALSESIDLLEPILAPDEGIPDVDELELTEPSDRADFKSFSDEEEGEIRDYAADYFEAYGI